MLLLQDFLLELCVRFLRLEKKDLCMQWVSKEESLWRRASWASMEEISYLSSLYKIQSCFFFFHHSLKRLQRSGNKSLLIWRVTPVALNSIHFRSSSSTNCATKRKVWKKKKVSIFRQITSEVEVCNE